MLALVLLVVVEDVVEDEGDLVVELVLPDLMGVEEAEVWPRAGDATEGGMDEGAGAAAFFFGAILDCVVDGRMQSEVLVCKD